MTRHEVDRLIDEVGLPQAGMQRRVAAVLFTYRCSIRCRHCLFGSAPDRPEVVMTARQCANALRLLHETGRVVHIAGGEPMLYWEILADAVRIACQEGYAPHFIETNCSFAADDATVHERFDVLKAHGVKGIYGSADPFHQEFVPAERFLRVRRIENIVHDEARLREHVRQHPPNMVGTAYRRLAPYLERCDPRDGKLPILGWQGKRQEPACKSQVLADTIWEIHIDPYGNIQSNCGIILGRLPETTPAKVLAEGAAGANRFVNAVCERGAVGLAELASREYGFVWPETASQTCELCYVTRRFLRKFHPEVFGPEEVYA
jgi:organic radical activating enzyme